MFREGCHAQKNKRRSKNMHRCFHRFFHWFSVKNRCNVVQKASKTALCTEIDENPRLESHFSANNRFLLNFCGPSGSPGASRDVPGASQNTSFFSLIFSCVWKRARTVPRGAPGRPLGSRGNSGYHIGSNFGSILHVKKHRKNIQY